MMDDILSDNSLDRLDRIERLESILAAASHHATAQRARTQTTRFSKRPIPQSA